MDIGRRDLLRSSGALIAVTTLTPRLAQAAGRPALPPLAPSAPLEPPEVGARLLEQGWRFHAGDVLPPKLLTHRGSYDATKAGNAIGAAAANFDDGDWRAVDLPHDWAIEAPPNRSENLAQGYRARGYAWYRRAFRLDPALKGRYLELQIGAIATNATLWVNGVEVAHNWSGYNAVSVDLTPTAVFGEALNTIAIRVDAERIEGWWYEGAGPYRHTWLVERAPVHIVTDGVHADPRRAPDGAWSIPVEATLFSIEDKPATVRVTADLLDAGGRVVATAKAQTQALPLARQAVSLRIEGITPRLWSVVDPYLYKVRTRVIRNDAVIDERITPCGFRTIRFDPEQGFFLNGAHLKIKGVCLHQDHAGVGVAVPDALVHWRVQQLKAMGCNAIRSSHNAPSTALLDACDRLGVLVMNENRLFNVNPDYVAQLEWLVRRDRNRPSVILWSVFNEEPSEASEMGYQMVRRMAHAVKALDDSRPVTAAMSSGVLSPINVSQAVDVVGFNYQQKDYDAFHAAHPTQPIISSEDTSAFMTRGAWKTDNAAHIKGSNDTEQALWGASQRASWKAIDTRPFVAGAFVWTGFDYHGEPSPFDWPSNSSYFGLLDLCGFPKAAYFIRRALWVRDQPVLHILPHWNWTAGEPVRVMVASNLERVQLLLNGKVVGDSAVDPYTMVTFAVTFAPGKLEARGWRADQVVATTVVETTGEPVSLRLTPARPRLDGDGADAVPVTIQALDTHGRPVPTADLRVELTVVNGRLIGVGNGNPTSLASGKETHVELFNGLAQAILQSERGSTGRLTLQANAQGVRAAHIDLALTPRTLPSIAPGPLRYGVKGWRQSPLAQEKPQRPEAFADNDMNSWAPVTPGDAPAMSATHGFLTLAATITLPARVAQNGGLLSFERINGRGSIWLNGAVAGEATAPAGPLQVRLAPGQRELRIAVVLEAQTGQRTGLPGVVFVQTEDAAA